MRHLFILAFLIACIRISAQDSTHVVDRVSTRDNKVLIGQITMDKKGDFLLIDVAGRGIDSINYSHITSVEYRVEDLPNDSSAAPIDTATVRAIVPSVVKKTPDTIVTLVQPPPLKSYSFDPLYAQWHRAGVALTLMGVGLMGGGAALLATMRDPGSNFARTISPAAAAGFIFATGGIAMTIPGALIWSRYPHRHSRR